MNIRSRLQKKSQIHLTPTKPLSNKVYPISGLFYKTEKGYFYVRSNKRYKVYSERCFASWAVLPIETEFKNLSAIPYAGILGFRDGSIIHNLADGKIYVVSDNKKLQLKTPDAFPEGWIEKYKVLVDDNEANLHKDGDSINGA